jgi:hypothetical protein
MDARVVDSSRLQDRYLIGASSECAVVAKAHARTARTASRPISNVRSKLWTTMTCVGIDAVQRRIAAYVDDMRHDRRKKDWKRRQKEFASGAISKYAQQVGPAQRGAATRPGAQHEAQCDADN